VTTRYCELYGGVRLLSLIIKTTPFLVYHLLIVVVDRISRLPRSGVQPDVECILRENLALKA